VERQAQARARARVWQARQELAEQQGPLRALLRDRDRPAGVRADLKARRRRSSRLHPRRPRRPRAQGPQVQSINRIRLRALYQQCRMRRRAWLRREPSGPTASKRRPMETHQRRRNSARRILGGFDASRKMPFRRAVAAALPSEGSCRLFGPRTALEPPNCRRWLSNLRVV
jgi:hypothetical protein